ncbi:hypothetical protein SELR_21380 [Selenomonas ruminantium subsp. lactilytica TAM6421]|uniref:Uncharacterized protein n=1 Tax=Selenomonas ruminantium subsp. lactilytica (strain NBRC 103574 / TAM6421) TaxID=927704 RepID=I0GSV9_SELRL|nr:hypothetical protein SELR_21380 [Selenomonas ruminantium subsp. lactilytica TAM6421]
MLKISRSYAVRGSRGSTFSVSAKTTLSAILELFSQMAPGKTGGASFSVLSGNCLPRAGLRWRSGSRSHRKSTPPFASQPRFWQSARTRFSRNKNIDVLVSSSRNIAALTNVTLGGGGDAFPPAERLPERSEGWPANSICWMLR